MGTFASLIDTFRTMLSTRVAVQAVRASNVANLDTPNFSAKVPDFSASLRSAVEQTAKPQESPWNIGLKVGTSRVAGREDGNNVNLEQEMSAIAENNLEYSAGVKMLSKHLALLRYAVGGSGG